MPDDSETLYQLAQAVSDGTDLDWKATDEGLDRTLLSDLEALAKLGAFHREGADRRLAEDPESWGPLRILERIGRGGFGEVYRALDPKLEREVALKLLRLDRTNQQRHKAAILKEARLLARVDHPNVAAVYGADEFEGRVGLWMKLIRGKTLEQWIEEHGPMSAAEATVIALDLCRALAAVHEKGLVHRDVTARNVMRREGGRILLTDFGLGEFADREQNREGLTGTPLYLPPEAFEGRPVDARGDIYSLGVLLYFLVTGKFPVQASDIAELRKMHGEGRARHLRDVRPGLPVWFVRAVEAALAPDPKDRYESVGQLEQSLTAGPKPVPEPRRRFRAPVWTAGIIAALLGVASIAYFSSAPPEAQLYAGIVMSDLDNGPGDPDLEGIVQMLHDRLSEAGFFHVPDPYQVFQAAEKRGVSVGDRLECGEAEAVAAGMFRFPVVLSPSIQRLGEGYSLRVEVIHVGAAPLGLRGSFAKNFAVSRKEDIHGVVSQAGDWLAGLIPKLKAQVFFREADGHFRNERRDLAVFTLRSALEEDDDFPLAKARLGNWLVDDGLFREGYRMELEALEGLGQIEDPLLAESRAKILALNDIEDYEKAEQEALLHTERFPDDSFGYFFLAFAESAQGLWDKAIANYRKWDDMPEVTGYHAMVQTAQLRFAQNDFESAAEAIEEVGKRPDSLPWALRLQGALDFLRGRPDEALNLFRKLQTLGPKDRSDALAAMAYIAGERGQLRKALRILDEGIEHDSRFSQTAQSRSAAVQDLGGNLNDKRLAKAYLLSRLGRWDELRELCMSEDFRNEAPYRQSKAGVLLARAGLLEEAVAILAWIDEEFVEGVPISERSRMRLEGEILIAEGDLRKGLELLREVDRTEPSFYHREYLARALRLAGERDEAFDQYKEFAAHPGIFWFLSVNEQYPGLYADTLLDYAKLAMEPGRGPEVESALRRYLELRREADDSLEVEIGEARRLLASVR